MKNIENNKCFDSDIISFAEKTGNYNLKKREKKPRRIYNDILKAIKTIRGYIELLRKKESAFEKEAEVWLLDNWYIADNAAAKASQRFKYAGKLPSDENGVPVINYLAKDLLNYTNFTVNEKILMSFLTGIQKTIELSEAELYMFIPALEAELLTETAKKCSNDISEEEALEKLFKNIFSSLRFLDNYDSSELMERVNLTEYVLSKDPAGIYAKMDDKTRHMYRTEISRLAAKNKLTEFDTAKKVLALAEDSGRHVGDYIFEMPLGKTRKNKTGMGYISSVILPTLFLDVLLGIYFNSITVILLCFLPITEIVKNIADYVILRNTEPKYLPRIELKNGLPESAKTLCAVSLMLTDKKSVLKNIESLEDMSRTNRNAGDNLYFGILADLPESDKEITKKESDVIAYAVSEIKKLNKCGNKFYFFIRKRTYDGKNGKYMGKERKRGAILSLVNFLTDGSGELMCLAGEDEALKGTHYIIALDSDTKINAEEVTEIVGTALHPMNTPVVDKEKKCVIKGAGIIQPRISVRLDSASKSMFSKVYAGIGGTDPYGSLASDIYQDLYGYGTFNGKGLINVPVYKMCLDSAFPDNTVLSHDFLEGAYIKTKYAGDIEFTDGYPYKVLSYYSRMHRWIRGDWQNSIWLKGYVSDGKSIRTKNPLTDLDKWKIIDNMRRSLVPVMNCISIFLGLLFGSAPFVVPAVISIISVMSGSLLTMADITARRCRKEKERYHSQIIYGVKGAALQLIYRFLFLPYEAYICLSAVITALYRMNISHNNMLAWVTSADEEKISSNTILGHYVKMAVSPVISLILIIFSPNMIGVPMAVLWLLSPLAAYAISRPIGDKKEVSYEQKEYLLHQAALIWKYFEENINEENNYLPPDNVQIDPPIGTAHRTSPTNIGLAVLSCLAAADLSVINEEKAYGYIEKIIDTVSKMDKYKGHLYNWYNTKTLAVMMPGYVSTVDSGNFLGCLITLKEDLKNKGREDLLKTVESLIEDMDFSFLYDKKANLFYIGFDVSKSKPTENHYDLMSSEARQTSYINVARGNVPKKHWRKLSRTLVSCDGYKGMVSWTGTMFEYLMPNLLLPCEKNSLSYESNKLCVYAQKKRTKGKYPWGISESCFYGFDKTMGYMYAPHGVQTVALKRDMDKKLVISPYSSFLALLVDTDSAVSNLKKIEKYDSFGKYGFYEAIDFTNCDESGKAPKTVKTYMAHHLGMSIVAIDDSLLDNIMQKRFMQDKNMRAYRELLQEKIPLGEAVLRKLKKDVPDRPKRLREGENSMIFEKIDYKNPLVFPVSNGSYTTLVSETGQSKSLWNECLIARACEDKFGGGGIDFKVKIGDKIYGLSPAASDIYNGYSFEYKNGQTVSKYEDEDIEIKLETSVFDDAVGEKRKISVVSKKEETVSAEIISYFEPVLQREQDFAAHPGFSKLQLELEEKERAVIVNRRGDDGKPVLSSCFLCDREMAVSTSRLETYGRHDPYFSYPENFSENFKKYSPENCIASSVKFSLEPKQKTEVNYSISAGFDPKSAYESAVKIIGEKSEYAADAFKTEASESCNVLEITVKMLSNILFGSGRYRYSYNEEEKVPKDEIWRFSISGDRPIFVYEFTEENIPELKDILSSKRYLENICVYYDLVIMLPDNNSGIEEQIKKLSSGINGTYIFTKSDSYGAIYDLGIKISDEMLKIKERDTAKRKVKIKKVSGKGENVNYSYNSDGSFGFTVDGTLPEIPWNNIVTNKSFGTIASDNGGGFMWNVNSHENKINKWLNDKANYYSSEKIEICFDGRKYSIFAADDGYRCDVTFGTGFAVWKKKIENISLETTMFVSRDKNVKVIIIKGENVPKQAKIKYYTDILMCDRYYDSRYVVTDFYDDSIKAYNRVNNRFSALPFIIKTSSRLCGFTTDKTAWEYEKLDGFTGTNMNPCAGMVTEFSGVQIFSMGCDTEDNVSSFLNIKAAEDELLEVKKTWREKVSKIFVKTGNENLDNYVNYWGIYQTVACRLYARTSSCQNSGAYGYRDQLQDAVCMLTTDSNLLAEQIFRCCAHQFVEGDVQHWWHPGSNQAENTDPGVRTLCSDDYMWLPYAVCEYYRATGDKDLLLTDVYYIESELPEKNNTVRYEIPRKSKYKGNVLDHAMRACALIIKRGFGSNGLCKILGGDWNDGMDMVGDKGLGESVWLTWFACIVFQKMAELCDELGLKVQSENYKVTSCILKENAEKSFYDGWFLRGYYDDGKALGKKDNPECEIDSLSQSFAQFAGANVIKTKTSLFNAYNMLFDDKTGITKLFSPPFDKGIERPGYIKRCCPGFRENGGQYTHGALWLSEALFETGEPDYGYKILNAVLSKDIKTYKGEPFIVAADVYTADGNYGRAGWTWYTGSAGWLYKVIVEKMLGIKIVKNKLYLVPNLPEDINECEIVYNFNEGMYKIKVIKGDSGTEITVNDRKYEPGGYDLGGRKKYALNNEKI